MIKSTLKLTFTGLILLAFFLSSCNHDRNIPAYIYMPDMAYSEAADAYTENPVFKDSLTMQTPVAGTIPRGWNYYPYKAKSYPDQVLAGQELINPVAVSSESLATGKAQYDIYCSICHGPSGQSDGSLYTSKKFPMKPTSLVDKYVQGKPDGELYHIITVGSLSGLMGAHGAQITQQHRWMIINYVRELAKK